MQSTEQTKAKFWQGHISSWKKSTVGIHEYCQNQGISKDTFYYWRKKMSSRSVHGKVDRSPRAPSAFVPVTIENSPINSSISSVYLEDPKWLGEFTAALVRGLR
jgi:hypothetical protein